MNKAEMIEKLMNIDIDIFYLINHCHTNLGDWLFVALSAKWSWVVILVATYMFLTLRKEPKAWLIILIGIGFCFFLADRVSVLAFKNVFMRLRPCNVLNNVYLLGPCLRSYSFVSGHAANSFALATFLSHRYSNIHFFVIGIYIWATLVSYSRVYIGVHYPSDILGGALLGLFCGWIVCSLLKKHKLQNLFKFEKYFCSKNKM